MSANRFHNALAPGYRLHWYEIESVLGQGGFGITYLATDTNLAQSVAIKEFLPTDLAVRTQDSAVHPISDARSDTFGWGLTRFLTEARTLAQFRHPNIVRVYSVFEANGTAYMVMEYERGTSLEDALKFRRLEGEKALLSLTHALMDGLELVHQAGFIHRDIKPDNIFMRAEDGVPVLLDFGSARQALGVETKTLTSLVTPGYAPFEQYNATRENDRQGPWTDIYSLAATLYRGVTGAGPVDAVARADALLSGERDPLQTLAQLEPAGFSAQLIDAIDCGLAFQSGDRPQSLAQWRAMLPVRPTTPDFTQVVDTVPADTARSATTVNQEDDTVVRGPPTREDDTESGAGKAETSAVEKKPAGDVDFAAPPARAAEDSPAGSGATRRPLAWTAVLVIAATLAWVGWDFYSQSRAPSDTGIQRSSAAAPVSQAVRPALEDGAGNPLGSNASTPADPGAVSLPTAQAGPAPTVQQADQPLQQNRSATLAAQREQLERDRAALQAERQALKLRTEQQAVQQARLEAQRQTQLLEEQREQLRINRQRLEALRAQQQAAALAQQQVREEAARAAADDDERARAAEQVLSTPAQAGAPPGANTQSTSAAVAPAKTAAGSEAAGSFADEPGQARIDTLLAQGRADEAALRLTSPEGGNALLRYREVLAIEPANTQALAGLTSIVSRYLSLAEQASAAAELERAEEYLRRAARVDAQDARIATAEARIVAQQARETDLARARDEQQRAERDAQRAIDRQAQREARLAAQREEQQRARLRAEQAAALERASAQAEAEAAAAAKAQADVQARAQADSLREVRLGIFPNDTLRSCYVPVGDWIEDTARKVAAANPRASIGFSANKANSNVPGLGDGRRAWQGNSVHKEPQLAVVQAVAKSIGVDAVLMGWYHCHDSPNISNHTYRAWVYLVDVRSGSVRVREAPLLDIPRAVRELLRELFAARGL